MPLPVHVEETAGRSRFFPAAGDEPEVLPDGHPPGRTGIISKPVKKGRLAVGGSAVLAVALAGTVAWPSAAETEAAAYTPTIEWGTCPEDGGAGEDAKSVQCGQLEVPVDWAQPDGEQVKLNVKRQRAADPDKRLGTLLTGPGGPGQLGTVVATDGYLPESVRNAYDVIGYDSRGVGDTKAQCGTAPEVNPLPGNEAEFDALAAANKRYGESCRTTPASLINHLDAASDARDMEALRQALGEEKLNYYGASYGTLRGQTYASLFPARTGRMVLDGNVDHSVPDARAHMGTVTQAAETSLNRFFEWCDETAECSLHEQGAKKTFTEVYASAEKADKSSPGHVYDLVNEATIGAANGEQNSRGWRDLADELRKRGEMSEPPARKLELDGPNQAIFCSDWDMPVDDYGAWKKMMSGTAHESPNLKISYQALIAASVPGCVGWPRQAEYPQEPLPAWHTDPRVLMVQSRHDVRTPYAWARAAARQSGAVLLTYDGGGHIVSWAPKVTGIVEKHLLTGTPPADGTHCDDSDCSTP